MANITSFQNTNISPYTVTELHTNTVHAAAGNWDTHYDLKFIN
jgi:hypothetical protein